jgi:hypothetical protein
MKILNSYSQMAKSLYIEADVDDDKIIKYKDKDGESAEMKASSAKTMEKDHPAKIAWDDMQGDDSDEKDSDGAIGGDDFDRDSNKAGEDEDGTGPGQGIDWKHPDDEEDDDDDEDGTGPGQGIDWKHPDDEEEKPSGEEESPEDRLEKVDKEIEDIEDQRGIIKQHMTSSGGGGISRSRRDQLEKEDKELLAKWRELQWARDDIQDEIDAKGEQEESIIINGQKYRPIKESKQHILKENYKRFFGSLK